MRQEMEIGIKHWFSVLSLAVLLHVYAALHVNLTGYSSESVHPFDQYIIDLTTLALPPKQIKLEPFVPPAPQKTRPPETKPEPEVKPPKPEPKPEKPKTRAPEVTQQKVVVPEFEQPVRETQTEPVQPSPTPPAPAQVPGTGKAAPENTSAAIPKPGTQAEKADYGYYQLILDRLERLKKYPSRARRRGEQGTVVLSFTLNRDGSLKHYKIRQSSGSKALDIAVKKLIKRATPFPTVPENISTDKLELSVPISFALN